MIDEYQCAYCGRIVIVNDDDMDEDDYRRYVTEICKSCDEEVDDKKI